VNTVNYRFPATRVNSNFGLTLFGLCFLVLALYAAGVPASWLLGLGSIAFGVNTVTYTTPVAGVTAPTAAQSRTHQMLIATITGDNSATTFVVTHNWALSVAELAAGYPVVILSPLLAAGYTAAALKTTSATNSVTFTNTAFTGAGLQVTLLRPWTAMR
jgi:hypothetical protein